jgi:hypothetical protein
MWYASDSEYRKVFGKEFEEEPFFKKVFLKVLKVY